MDNNIDNGLEELEIEEVFDADALQKELDDILKEDADNDADDYDEIERLLTEKNEARKKKSVLLARRRKRQLKTMSIIAAAISVVLTVAVIVIFVALMKDAVSSLNVHDTDVLAATRGVDAYGDVSQSGTANQETEPETHTSGIQSESASQDESEFQSQIEKETEAETQSEKIPEQTKTPESTKQEETTTKAQQVVTTPGKYVTITDSNITAGHAALYDVSAGTMIAGKSPYAKMYPASMTKVMTLIVACETITNWNAKGTLTAAEANYLYIEGASRAGYEAGDSDEAKDLIYGLVLKSGCDAAMMLAKVACGSEESFVARMNAKCKELGLSNTHFTNSTGLHDNNQYTTVADMCKIMEYAMNKSLCSKVLGTYSYGDWTHNNIKTYNETVYQSNVKAMKALNNKGISVLGVKSGYTVEAGNCLVTCVEKNGKRYIAVVSDVKGKGQSTINSTRIFLNYI